MLKFIRMQEVVLRSCFRETKSIWKKLARLLVSIELVPELCNDILKYNLLQIIIIQSQFHILLACNMIFDVWTCNLFLLLVQCVNTGENWLHQRGFVFLETSSSIFNISRIKDWIPIQKRESRSVKSNWWY